METDQNSGTCNRVSSHPLLARFSDPIVTEEKYDEDENSIDGVVLVVPISLHRSQSHRDGNWPARETPGNFSAFGVLVVAVGIEKPWTESSVAAIGINISREVTPRALNVRIEFDFMMRDDRRFG